MGDFKDNIYDLFVNYAIQNFTGIKMQVANQSLLLHLYQITGSI